MKRQYYLDYAKCSAIIFMITIHVFWKLGCDLEAPVGYFINSFLGGFMAAPVFMVAMGMGFAFTSNNEPKYIILRGFQIIILGYFLNVLRELPIALYDFSRGAITFDSHELWFELLMGDVLQFAGIAMIIFGVLRSFNLSDKIILVIAGMMSLTGYLIPIIYTDSIAINATLGLFIFVNHPKETMMCFPLFTWFIYPAFGYFLAEKLKIMEYKDKFFKNAILPCFLFALIGSLLEAKLRVFMMKSNNEFYHMQSHDALISICYTVFCFSLFYFICNRLSDKINYFFASISDALNQIYVIHWPLVYLAVLFFIRINHTKFNYPYGFTIFIIITFISVILGISVKKIINKHKK